MSSSNASLSLSLSSMSSSASLKSAQLRAVQRMLAFNDERMIHTTTDATTTTNSMTTNHPTSTSTHSSSSSSSSTLLSAASAHQWKILIYDTHCRSILSPLLNVQQLRRNCGVTLHLLLHSDREAIPDVPALYFCQPSRENIVRIASDCAQHLYRHQSGMHIHFCSKLERPLLEELAKLVVETGTVSNIASIHDQYVDFIALEQNLFSLAIPQSYQLYNGSNIISTAADMDVAMQTVALGLFSVVATLGRVPILRCPKGGAPEMVARKLHTLIADHPTLLRSSSASSTSSSNSTTHHHHHHHHQSNGRTLLVILDRNADLITPLQHTSTYQALMDDVLQHRANRVEFDLPTQASSSSKASSSSSAASASTTTSSGSTSNTNHASAAAVVRKKYDLDPDADPFYVSQKFLPFPEAIETNGHELQEVTAREQAIRSNGSSNSNSGVDASSIGPSLVSGSGGASLALAVESLPALLERKKQLEVHTSVLQAVMNQVALRDIPQYYELENDLASGSYNAKSVSDAVKAKRDVMNLIVGGSRSGSGSESSSKGSLHDKLRLITVWALATNAKGSDIEEVTSALQQWVQSDPTASVEDNKTLMMGLKALNFVKQLRSTQIIHSTGEMLQSMQVSSSSNTSFNAAESTFLSSFMAKATTQASGLLAKATDKVISSMLGKTLKLPATRVVENLCDFKAAEEDETYLYLDAKVQKADIDVQQLRRQLGTSSSSSASTVAQIAASGGSYYSSTLGGGGNSSTSGGSSGGGVGSGGIGFGSTLNAVRAPISHVIVFVIGGGCYGEYQNLQTSLTTADGRPRQVTYGSTEIVNATDFLEQLGQLG